ncbi:J domain-containing protein [Aliiroseovarius sp. PTFE2010]|uniref:J domain-containing protein n=1 Tax=Aliiroseovarius sp. PTFE2010 TaxID=3417190 RepID=UPI003CE95DEF
MTKSDPFGFDLSVSSDKKKRARGRRGMSGAFETSKRECEHEGCTKQGQYRAPRSPDHLDEYKWFCKEHVREYNLKWNFFSGATEAEMEEQMAAQKVGERPTQPFKSGVEERAWSRLGIDDPHQVLGGNATQNPGKSVTGTRKLPPTERKAVDILEAKDHWTKAEVRKQYKALIKVLHPDMNGGDRSQEEQLQEVVWAWDQLKDSRYFK